MKPIFTISKLTITAMLSSLAACGSIEVTGTAKQSPSNTLPPSVFMAQVVGVQWLNPLQRKDYSTEWQLLWTMGLVQPNPNDDMVRENAKKYSTLQPILSIAAGNKGTESFDGYYEKYVGELINPFFDVYFSDSRYFYNVHSLDDRKTWRELAGIHVELAIPANKLDPVASAKFLRDEMVSTFSIGSQESPTLWSRPTPPDIKVTEGAENAGFSSLKSALDHLQSHPDETVWVMNWDAPSRPKDMQINENMVLLVLAGPNYKTERAALAWIGYPAMEKVSDFQPQKGAPSAVQAWKAAFDAATRNAGKSNADIGFVIHDANNRHPDPSDGIGNLAQTITTGLAGFDFMKQTFNTPALLGEMGAGTALTNVVLAIGYANHLGKNVLVAGTSDAEHATAVMIIPPAVARPINPDKPWFRARTQNNAYLFWWGIRHDTKDSIQGYSK